VGFACFSLELEEQLTLGASSTWRNKLSLDLREWERK
jgi:hypothetical protein